MTTFDDIRPYNDDEVRTVLDRVLVDPDFKSAMGRLTLPKLSKIFPGLAKQSVSWFVKRQFSHVDNVKEFQNIVQRHMTKMMSRTMSGLTSSGLEHLNRDKAHLFVSNHRDIAMDPALIDWVLHENKFETARLAIGDNLLTMPYASDIMRLNKSFIVNRSAKGNKEKFKALKHLSAYLHHSIIVEKSDVWIAQRQGRAKDGLDRTESAVLKMFAMNKNKEQTFSEYIRELSIVPVSISYEWDPLDEHKAMELFHQKEFGEYQKGEHEDIVNIAKGIDGTKGRVHVAFGQELSGDYQDADELAFEIDKQIIENYVLQPSNCFAYKALHGEVPDVTVGAEQHVFEERKNKSQELIFTGRLQAMDTPYRTIVQEMYANPIVSKLEFSKLAAYSDKLKQQNEKSEFEGKIIS
ncbi:MAG: 1-acyl-sn-glycerol-3-phosphate acyltransferase [Cellvibrionaceae bacterium]